MGFDLIPVAQPVLAGDRHVEQSRAEVQKRDVEAAAIKGHDAVVAFGDIPKGGQEFYLIDLGGKFHGGALGVGLLQGVFVKIVGLVEYLTFAGVGIDHGDTHYLSGEGPQAELL